MGRVCNDVRFIGLDAEPPSYPTGHDMNGNTLEFMGSDFNKEIKLPDNSVSLGFSFETAPYLDMTTFLPEVHRVLEPGGKAYIHWHERFDRAGMIHALSKEEHSPIRWFSDDMANKKYQDVKDRIPVHMGFKERLPNTYIEINKSAATQMPCMNYYVSVPREKKREPLTTYSLTVNVKGQIVVKRQDYCDLVRYLD